VVDVTRGGMIFAEGDDRALAETLGELRADPGLRRRLAAEGHRRVAEIFSVEAVATTFGALLERTAAPEPLGGRSRGAAAPRALRESIE
jgi:glycosyltransferase involved in cell wall biosynthesis